MRPARLITVGAALIVALYGGSIAWDNWQSRTSPQPDSALQGLIISEQFLRPEVFSEATIQLANEGVPEASLKYGYHLLADAIVNEKDASLSVPYLTVGAMAGNIGAHVQLGLIEAALKDDGDLVRAWAHFDVALTKLEPGDPDYPSSKKHHDEIFEALSEPQRTGAQSLSDEFFATIKASGNALK